MTKEKRLRILDRILLASVILFTGQIVLWFMFSYFGFPKNIPVDITHFIFQLSCLGTLIYFTRKLLKI